MKQLALLAPALALLACAPAGSPEAAKSAAEVKTPHAFEVQLTLTPRTIEKLEGMGEMITISAIYLGRATAERLERVDYGSGVGLGKDLIKVQPANRLIAVPGPIISAKLLAEIAGEPQVEINVATSRTVNKDNLINCGIYEGPISMAQQKAVDIRCDLIEPPAPS